MKNIPTQRPQVKLDNRRVGLFQITEAIESSVYRLELPASMIIHPVFHVSLLELEASNTYPGQIQSPSLPVVVDGEEVYGVEEILNSRIQWKRLEYLVKWS